MVYKKYILKYEEEQNLQNSSIEAQEQVITDMQINIEQQSMNKN